MSKKKKRIRRRHRIAFRKNVVVGASPGVLPAGEHKTVPPIRVIAYGPDKVEEFEPATAEELRGFRGRQPVVWINVDGVENTDTVRTIGEIFDLHPLALEDVVRMGQRPKAEDYEDKLFVVLQVPRVDHKLELEQVSLFLGKGFVISFQEKLEDSLAPVRERVRHGRGRVRKMGADYLAYALIDAIVDSYFPALERYGTLLDALEDQVMRSASADTNGEIHAVRQELSSLRRPIWALRETLGPLSRNERDHFTRETQVFLRDSLDHTWQLMDVVESCREMGASLMDFHLSNMSHRMNEVMKVLTVIATVFIPLSFIAGVYGMNFDQKSSWNMPELSWTYGYPFALGLMALTSLGFVIYFRRKGWLGQGSKEDNSHGP